MVVITEKESGVVVMGKDGQTYGYRRFDCEL